MSLLDACSRLICRKRMTQWNELTEALCFPIKFVQWVMEYIRTIHYSIMINREPTKPFDAAGG